jgi:hypothetical protein
MAAPFFSPYSYGNAATLTSNGDELSIVDTRSQGRWVCDKIQKRGKQVKTPLARARVVHVFTTISLEKSEIHSNIIRMTVSFNKEP